MHVRSYRDLEAFISLDGSEIREWAGRISAPAKNQSLAEAILAAIPPHQKRDRLLFRLILETGLRVGEALGLHVEDLQPGRGRLLPLLRRSLPRHGRRDEFSVAVLSSSTGAVATAFAVFTSPAFVYNGGHGAPREIEGVRRLGR